MQTLDKTRDSEDDEEEEETPPQFKMNSNGIDQHHNQQKKHQTMMSVLIDETLSDYQANYNSQQDTNRRDRGLQSEDQWEEERMEFTTNNSNITKDRHYVAWKEKAKAAKQEAEAVKEENSALKRERTKTVEHVHSLKKKVEELENVKNTEITAY